LEAELTENKLWVKKLKIEQTRLLQRLNVLKHDYADYEDRERRDFIWDEITEVQANLSEIENQLANPPKITLTEEDIERVKSFLVSPQLWWDKQSRTTQNRLLSIILEKIEVWHDDSNKLRCVIYWKSGGTTELEIRIPFVNKGEKVWSDEEIQYLRLFYPSSSKVAVHAAIPNRSWSAISAKAAALGLKRRHEGQRVITSSYERWNKHEDDRLTSLYEKGLSYKQIGQELHRSPQAIHMRLVELKRSGILLCRPEGVRKLHSEWKTAESEMLSCFASNEADTSRIARQPSPRFDMQIQQIIPQRQPRQK
jgi:hypothetical protein